MPRPPDHHSGRSLTFHANTPAEEERLKAFKELHARNPELSIQKTMMESVDLFLAQHNYPPGNSQTLLAEYGAIHKLKCERCGEMFDHLFRAKFVSGLVADYCKACLERAKAKTTVKKVLGAV